MLRGMDGCAHGVFPPVNSGGLIEAGASSFFFFEVFSRFPPVNSGGLIEAGSYGSTAVSG